MTENFDLASKVKDADLAIRNIFDQGTLAIPDGCDITIKRNTTILKKFVVEKFCKEYDEKFGFSQETFDADIWPTKKAVAEALLKKMELISPGLNRKTNPQINKVEQLPICNALLRRFYDETLVKKDRLKILPRKRGNIDSFFQLKRQEI